MLEWIDSKAIQLIHPDFADVFIGRQSFECFKSFGEVVGHQEYMQVGLELIVRSVMIAFNCSLLWACRMNKPTKFSSPHVKILDNPAHVV